MKASTINQINEILGCKNIIDCTLSYDVSRREFFIGWLEDTAEGVTNLSENETNYIYTSRKYAIDQIKEAAAVALYRILNQIPYNSERFWLITMQVLGEFVEVEKHLLEGGNYVIRDVKEWVWLEAKGDFHIFTDNDCKVISFEVISYKGEVSNG